MAATKLKKLSTYVRWILEEYPLARSDDRYLVTAVYTLCYGVDPDATFRDVMKNYSLPPFESIRRARQKIQEVNEHLRGDEAIEKIRMALQEDYIEFSKETEL